MNHQSETNERRFISLEGGDGAGKTTITRLMYDELTSANVPVTLVYPKHPHFRDNVVESFMVSMLAVLGGPRHLLTDSQWLNLTATWYHVINERIVQPALERGEIVIADTWYYKPLVRFGLLGQQLLEEGRRCFGHLVQPSLTCFLDIAPEISATRKTEFGFGETGNFEGPREMNKENFVSYQRRFHRALSMIAKEEGWPTIKVEQHNPEFVARHILGMMRGRGWI